MVNEVHEEEVLPEDYKPISEISVRRKDFKALKGFTSEKYKEKRRQRYIEIERFSRIYRNRERLLKLLELTQVASIIAIITLIAAVMVLI